ncbi:MAG: nucleoside hydrolase [Luteitalea sp.]
MVAGCHRRATPAADGRTAVWLDISPSLGDPPRDPTDTMALVQAFGADRLRVAGVSVTFGNVPLVRGFPVAGDVMERLGTGGLRPWRGPSGPDERFSPTEATELLAERLETEPLTIVALGPLTTVAALLGRHPHLRSQLQRVVLVAGRRPSQRLLTGTTNPRGHRDPSVELDPGSFQLLLDSSVPVTVIALEAAMQVSLTSADLARFVTGPRPARTIVPPARSWLGVWKDIFGVDGFVPFGLAAVDLVAHPSQARCEAASAQIEWADDDQSEPRLRGPAPATKPYLIVRTDAPGRSVTWCPAVDPALEDRIIADVLRAGT